MRIAKSLCCFFIGIQFLFAQQDSGFIQLVISGISKYRSEILQRDSSGRIVFGILLKENKKVNWDDKSSTFQNYLPVLYDSESNFAKYNQKFLNKIYGDSSVLSKFNIDVLRVYRENSDLINCFRLDALEDEYPFKIKKDSKLFNELSFYQIHDEEKILFIGESDYVLGKIANNIYNNLKIYTAKIGIDFKIIREVEQDSVKLKDTLTSDLIKYFDLKSSHIENEKPDKIIMRGVFDIFSVEKNFIKSLRDNLRKDGKLFILVPDPFLIEDKKEYKQNISIQEKLFKRLSQYGFVLEEDQVIDKLILYRFHVKL